MDGSADRRRGPHPPHGDDPARRRPGSLAVARPRRGLRGGDRARAPSAEPAPSGNGVARRTCGGGRAHERDRLRSRVNGVTRHLDRRCQRGCLRGRGRRVPGSRLERREGARGRISRPPGARGRSDEVAGAAARDRALCPPRRPHPARRSAWRFAMRTERSNEVRLRSINLRNKPAILRAGRDM